MSRDLSVGPHGPPPQGRPRAREHGAHWAGAPCTRTSRSLRPDEPPRRKYALRVPGSQELSEAACAGVSPKRLEVIARHKRSYRINVAPRSPRPASARLICLIAGRTVRQVGVLAADEGRHRFPGGVSSNEKRRRTLGKARSRSSPSEDRPWEDRARPEEHRTIEEVWTSMRRGGRLRLDPQLRVHCTTTLRALMLQAAQTRRKPSSPVARHLASCRQSPSRGITRPR
jgi:hypothetical protein